MAHFTKKIKRLAIVSEMLASGKKQYEISEELGVSIRTVRRCVAAIKEKVQQEYKEAIKETFVRQKIEMENRKRKLYSLLNKEGLTLNQELQINNAIDRLNREWRAWLISFKIIGKEAPESREPITVKFIDPCWRGGKCILDENREFSPEEREKINKHNKE